MNKTVSDLLAHPILEKLNPARRRLVRLADPLSSNLNPFTQDGVEIRPAILFDSTFNSKAHVAYELLVQKIKSGQVTAETALCVPSSGNTGLGVAQMCKALGIRCEIVMPSDTPATKVGVISALGHPIEVTLLSSGTVAYAREKGQQKDWFALDQYAESANIDAHRKYLAPQFQHLGKLNVLIVPGGTLGTATALKNDERLAELSTQVVVAICADDEEIPGARDAIRIRKDVKIASLDDFEHVRTATRKQAFLANYALFPEMEWTQGGPTSGLSLSVALNFVNEHKKAGTLDRFRGSDRRVRVAFLCPDDYRLYGDLYRSTLHGDRDFQQGRIPVSRLLD